jgi:hypothetical protein
LGGQVCEVLAGAGNQQEIEAMVGETSCCCGTDAARRTGDQGCHQGRTGN